MDGVAALVEQLDEVAEAADRIRREDPGGRGRPARVPMPIVNATGIVGRPGRGTTS